MIQENNNPSPLYEYVRGECLVLKWFLQMSVDFD